MKLSHIDDKGAARMVDVDGKEQTQRRAVAEGAILMKPETLRMAMDGSGPKGDIFQAARLAGIMAAKKTPDLIPLCHPIQLGAANVDLAPDEAAGKIVIRATVSTKGRTGAEMEALAAVSVAALTVYDMLKAVDKEMEITGIRLIEKTGGKSGDFARDKR